MLSELAHAEDESDPLVQGAMAALDRVIQGDNDGAADHVSLLVGDNPDAVIPVLWAVWCQVIVKARTHTGKPVLPLPSISGQEDAMDPAEQAVLLVQDGEAHTLVEVYQGVMWDGMAHVANVSIVLMKSAAMAYSQAKRARAR